MRIKIINPNTTASMTAKIGAAAVAAVAPGTEVVVCQPTRGPVSIESHYDEAVSVIGVLDEIHRGEAKDAMAMSSLALVPHACWRRANWHVDRSSALLRRPCMWQVWWQPGFPLSRRSSAAASWPRT